MNTDIVSATALRITCSKAELAASLGVVSRAVSTRGAVQVLGGILLQAEDGRLSLAATDMEISIRASLAGEVEGDASVVVPGRLLTDLVRLLPDDSVTLAYEEGDGVLAVTSGSHSSRLNVYSAEDFPRLPPLDVTLQTIDAAALARDHREGRPRGVARRVATRPDGRARPLRGRPADHGRDRLVPPRGEGDEPLVRSGPDLDAIIPARALQELARLAAGAEDVRLGVHENHVIFSANDVWLTSRRIDGQFPNYKQLLPETFEAEIATPRAALLDVVRRAGLMAQRNAPLRLRFADGELTVSAQTQDVGEATESLPIEYAGEELEIGFNPDFLRDGLEAVAADTVQLKLINRLRPGLIAAPDESFWYLIMPIRLAG